LNSRLYTIKIYNKETPVGPAFIIDYIIIKKIERINRLAKLELYGDLSSLSLPELQKEVQLLKELPESEKERAEIERQMGRAMYLDKVNQKIALASVIIKNRGGKYAEKLIHHSE